MKTTLTLEPVSANSFRCLPCREIELPDERILCNDVTFPWENHPHNMRLWVIGNEYGALGAVWASHERDAFDELCDAGLSGGLAIDEADADEDSAMLGNAGEPHDLTNCWIQTVRFTANDFKLIARFAEARGAVQTTLDK